MKSSAIEEDKVNNRWHDWRLLVRLFRFARPFLGLIVIAVFLIILSSFLSIVGPYLIKIAVDRYILPGDFQGLIGIALLYLGAMLSGFFARYGQTFLTQYLGQKIIFNLRDNIFQHLQHLHQQFFDRNPVGRLMTRVISDVESLNQVFTQGIVMIFGDLFLIIGIIIMMLSLHFQLAMWTLSILPVLIGISFLFRKKVRHAYGQIRYHLARINAYMQERIQGMVIVQAFNRETRDWKHFSDINKRYTHAFIKTIFYYALFYPAVEVISATALAIIIFRGGWLLHRHQVTLGILIAFIQYTKMFFRPISDLSEKYNILQSALASSERIFKLLDTPPAIISPKQGYRKSRIEGHIRIEGVWFAYHEDYVLKDIHLEIPAGKHLAIVGHTGSGKSTLIRLIGRLYDIQKGRILIDGVDIRNWDLAALRQRMAVVLQDVFLFSGTVFENIQFGRHHISREQIIKVAKLVNAHEFIMRLPGGYEATIKERGSNLSVGQKQLISLARALVGDPDILILDEATANIDSESEALIQDALKVVLQNRTAIVIAHRLSTIQHMDQIVVLHKGRIREMGSHQQLLRQRGIYYRLYKLQYQERRPPVAVPMVNSNLAGGKS